jgi:hypothetical protein
MAPAFTALVQHKDGDWNRELLLAKQGKQNREQGILLPADRQSGRYLTI